MDNTQDIIDSRDVIERLGDLAGQWQRSQNDPDEDILTEDEREELEALTKLDEQGESVEDWAFGVTLIRDSYFTEYAKELADDIGAIEGADMRWPNYCIDWEWAAKELQMDYTSVDFDGVTYWVR